MARWRWRDFICGQFYGRVRAMYDERGQTVDAAGPSTPVQVLGFEGVPKRATPSR